MERPARAVDEAGDAVLLGLGRVLATQRLHPARRQLRFDEIVAAGIKHLVQRHIALLGQHQPRIAVHRTQHGERGLQRVIVDQIALAHHDHVGELDLLGEQIHDTAVVVLTGLLAAVDQPVT